jgi:hypothetical protein
MNYDWYNIYNMTEFLATGLVSRTVTVIFDGLGLKEILLTKGYDDGVSVLFDDVFLKINLNDKNPFEFEDRAVYLDSNNDIWVGIAVDES